MKYAQELSFNRAQRSVMFLYTKIKVLLWGRGTGKSNCIGWEMKEVARLAPKSTSFIASETYADALTKTLPATLSFLERIGFINGVNFLFGKKPPERWKWKKPFETPLDYKFCFSFPNGAQFVITSQDRPGASRGMNNIYGIADEGLKLNKKQFDEENLATLRGYKKQYGHLPFYKGVLFASSMPTEPTGQWLLDLGNYYLEDYKIDIQNIWNQCVELQLRLIEIGTDNKKEFVNIYNEIIRLKKKIRPIISKDGVLFSLANAFDNLENVGFDYFTDNKTRMLPMTFLVELMNYISKHTEDGFYNIQSHHLVHDTYDYNYIDLLNLEGTKQIVEKDCRWDKDINKKRELILCFDFGKINCMWVCQGFEDNQFREFRVLNSHHILSPGTVTDLINWFIKYYQYHPVKKVRFVKDKYGNVKPANAKTTYNEDVIRNLENAKWEIEIEPFKGQEIPYHQRHMLWQNCLAELDPKFPIVRINANNNKDGILSLRNAKIKDVNGKLEKVKTSERDPNIPRQHATDYSDALDKGLWVYHHNKRSSMSILPTVIHDHR